jgi:hypothetical protein
MSGFDGVDEADFKRLRTCACCTQTYSVAEFHATSARYFSKPENYQEGCWTTCLACWLGVGPDTSEQEDTGDSEGNLLRDCGASLPHGTHLVVMPIARVTLDIPIRFPGNVIMYPSEMVDLDRLNVVPFNEQTTRLPELQSARSGIDVETIRQHATIAFPVAFEWDELISNSHAVHMEFIRFASETADSLCLDLVRYGQCRIGNADALPARAGQVDSNHMMAGIVLYNPARQTGRILGGAAFTHFVTKGVGLPVETPPDDGLHLHNGEIGFIVRHAFSLYAALLETDSATMRFVQALSLLEFLASPYRYDKFERVAKIVARYVADSPDEYERVKERFRVLTGNKDPDTGVESGYGPGSSTSEIGWNGLCRSRKKDAGYSRSSTDSSGR